MKLSTAVLIVLCFLSSASKASLKLKTLPTGGHLEFLAIGRPAMIRIKGESAGPEGQVEINDGKATGHFKLHLASLTTGIDMRDNHMKEKYLEIAKFPDSELTLQSLALKDPSKNFELPFQGTLSLHGVTKAIEGLISYETIGHEKKSHGEFKIRLSDFGIAIPSYAGMTVADEVQIKLDFQLQQQAD